MLFGFLKISLCPELCVYTAKISKSKDFFLSEIVIVITFIQTLGEWKWSDKYCWKDNLKKKISWLFPVCTADWTKARAFKFISILSWPHSPGWAQFDGEAAAGISFMQGRCESLCCTRVTQHLTSAEYFGGKPSESQTLPALSSQNSGSSSSEGWLRVQISTSKAGFFNNFMEESSRKDTISKEKGRSTADNFVRGLLVLFPVKVSPEFPISAEGHELLGTKSQEIFRFTNFDKRVFVFCSGIVL